LGSWIKKNSAPEVTQTWFCGYRIARNALMGPLHLRVRAFRFWLPPLRTEDDSRQLKAGREPILTRVGGGLAAGEPVAIRAGLFASLFLRMLLKFDEAGPCAFCWI
jgi:hypothetical protein